MALVSVIVPVFNLFDYIDRCLESIVNQTFRDIEIILINDGSTDNSDEKCFKWAENDKRIKYIKQENKGIGAVRNIGISEASGEYLSFVDGDDCINPTMVEKLIHRALLYDSDIVFCGHIIYREVSSNNNCRINIKTHTNIKINRELIYVLSPSVCDKMIKKSLFIENIIWFPERCRNEDMIVVPKLALFAQKISNVNENLYYYYANRPNNFTSTISKTGTELDILRVMDETVDFFKKNNEYNENRLVLSIYFKGQVNNWVNLCRMNFNKSKFITIISKYIRCFNSHFNFSNIEKNKIGIWGSYNSRATLQTAFFDSQNISFQYSNSSIISAMNSSIVINIDEIKIENQFKKDSLVCDLSKDLVKNSSEILNFIDYILIDFLEERFPIGLVDASIITLSDAYNDSNVVNLLNIKNLEDEYNIDILWKKKCLDFITLLGKYLKPEQIILNEIYLCEVYGNTVDKNEFENISLIKKVNKRLKNYYEFFKENFKGINVIKISDKNIIFTNEGHRYGSYAYHLNELAYFDLANQIGKII